MELDIFAHRFEKLIRKNRLENQFEFYLFGSFVKSQQYTDIDILIIYSDHEKLSKLRQIIDDEFFDNLIHLTCLIKREEIELDFINITNARKLNL